MATNARLRIAGYPVTKQSVQCSHLFLGKIIPADQTDTKAFFVMPVNMRACPEMRATLFNGAVLDNNSVIAYPVPAKPQMHSVNVRCG